MLTLRAVVDASRQALPWIRARIGSVEANEFNFNSRRAWFVALVTYYLFTVYLVPSSGKVERLSFTYFALVIPAWLFIAANWKYLLTGYSLVSKSMATFAVLAGAVGLAKWDIPLSYNALFLAGMAIVILNSKVYLTVIEINWMFLGTVIGSIAVFALGITSYGFLPGQAEGTGCHAAMNWRISLFRVTAESAMFSFLVLIANIAYGDRLPTWIRGLAIFVASYFLIFSGVRSIVVPASIIVVISILFLMFRISTRARLRTLVGIFAGTVTILSVPYWLGTEDGFWENYLLKTQSCDYLIRYGYIMVPGTPPTASGEPPSSTASGEPSSSTPPSRIVPLVPSDWLAWTFNRHCSAMYQLSLLAKSPLGNRDLQPKSDQQLTAIGCPTDQLNYYCTGCNLITHWLARAGITAIPLALAFMAMIGISVFRRRVTQILVLIVFATASLSWGVMFVPYNVIFHLLFAIPAFAAAHERA